MPGMNRYTGRRISDTAQIEQQIITLLGIRKGEYVMMNDIGSENVDLVDSPQNQFFLVDMAMGVMDPIARWVPKVIPYSCRHIGMTEQGRAEVELIVIVRATGEQLRIAPIVLAAAGMDLTPGKEIGR